MEAPEPPRCRRCLTTTTTREIAASTAIAIKIGTRGDEPSSSLDEVDASDWPPCFSAAPAGVPLEPASRLLCPLPPSLPAFGVLPPDEEDGPPAADPVSEESEPVESDVPGTEDPPLAFEECAGSSWRGE